jgi:hypothetical protein
MIQLGSSPWPFNIVLAFGRVNSVASLVMIKVRGWVALIAGIFLVVIMTCIWVFIASHVASGTASLPTAGQLYIGFALIIGGGFLAIASGVWTLWKGRPNLPVGIVMIVLFVAAFFVIQQATKGLGTP